MLHLVVGGILQSIFLRRVVPKTGEQNKKE
jgi:hypothetical protein